MTDPTLNNQLMARLAELASSESGLEIPPKIFVDMGGEIIDFEPGQSMTVRFPVHERYQNPMGMMQGGMIVAAIDNTMGPLSFLLAPPSSTTQLNTTFLRPVSPDNAYIDVAAWLAERTRQTVHLSARVKNQQGKVVAISHATFRLLTG